MFCGCDCEYFGRKLSQWEILLLLLLLSATGKQRARRCRVQAPRYHSPHFSRMLGQYSEHQALVADLSSLIFRPKILANLLSPVRRSRYQKPPTLHLFDKSEKTSDGVHLLGLGHDAYSLTLV